MSSPIYPIVFRKAIEDQILPRHTFLEYLESPNANSICAYRVTGQPFVFEVQRVETRQRDHQEIAFIYVRPRNGLTGDDYSTSGDVVAIRERFERWLAVVDATKSYVSPFQKEKFFKAYDQEFFSANGFSEEDTRNELRQPLSLAAQTKVLEFTAAIRDSVSNDSKLLESDGGKELLQHLDDLEQNLGTFTVYQAFIHLARFFSMLRMYGMPVFLELLKHYAYGSVLHILLDQLKVIP